MNQWEFVRNTVRNELMTYRYRSLDGLRGIMATAVMLGHIGLNTVLARLGLTLHFELAVDFFFVLSGFVLSTTYYFGQRDARAFVISRLFRLWPLHAVTATWVLWLTAAQLDASYWENLLLINNVGLAPQTFSLNFPAWSISVEMWVSLAVFLIVRIATAAWVGALAMAGVLALMLLPQIRGGGAHNLAGFVNTGLLRGLCGFMAGVAVYVLVNKIRPRVSKWPEGLRWLALALVATGMLQTLTTPNNTTLLLFYIACPFTVLCYAMQEGRWLSGWLLTELGRLSYAIYLLHIPVLYSFERFVGQDASRGLSMKLAMVVICFGLAWLAHRGLELPMIKLGKQMIVKLGQKNGFSTQLGI